MLASSSTSQIVCVLALPLKFCLPPALLGKKRKKKVNEKEASEREREGKKVGACLQAERRVFLLMDNLCHFLIEHRRSERKKIEWNKEFTSEWKKKKLGFILERTYYNLACLLMMFMLIVVGSNE
jgi:hypothetical protein